MDLIKFATAESRGPLVSRLGSIGLVVIGAALAYAGAKIHVPFFPVPMTLQTVAVMGLAIAYGPRHAMAAFGLYLALGAAGLPVFADTPARGIGLGYMMGPTGGYLLGFFLACGLVGALSRGRGSLGRVVAMLAGLALVYTLGVLWLTHFVGSLELAIKLGALRFLPGDLLKIALVTAVASLGDSILNRETRA